MLLGIKLLNGIIVGLILTCAIPLAARGQNVAELDGYGRWVNGVTEPWWFPEDVAKDAKAEVQSRWVQLGVEAASQADGWTGDYFVGGDTRGSYLRLGRTGFVVFRVNKCAASVMGFSYGEVVQSSTLIQLLPQKTEHTSRVHGRNTQPASRYLPVTWRTAKYLVPEAEISGFGDYVAGLGEYNDPNFSLIDFAPFFVKSMNREASGDNDESKTNPTAQHFVAPVVPVGYERFIRKPIEAQIIARGKPYVRYDPDNEWWNKLIIPVTVDAGRAEGLTPKLVLHILDSPGAEEKGELVLITKVNARTARGVIERSVRKQPCVKFHKTDDCTNPEYDEVNLGSRLTTNPVPQN